MDSYNGMACGVTQDGSAFYSLQTGQQASLDVITTGATTRATARVDGGKITEFIIQEPGSGYGQNLQL